MLERGQRGAPAPSRGEVRRGVWRYTPTRGATLLRPGLPHPPALLRSACPLSMLERGQRGAPAPSRGEVRRGVWRYTPTRGATLLRPGLPHPPASLRSACPLSMLERGQRGAPAPSRGEVRRAVWRYAPTRALLCCALVCLTPQPRCARLAPSPCWRGGGEARQHRAGVRSVGAYGDTPLRGALLCCVPVYLTPQPRCARLAPSPRRGEGAARCASTEQG